MNFDDWKRSQIFWHHINYRFTISINDESQIRWYLIYWLKIHNVFLSTKISNLHLLVLFWSSSSASSCVIPVLLKFYIVGFRLYALYKDQGKTVGWMNRKNMTVPPQTKSVFKLNPKHNLCLNLTIVIFLSKPNLAQDFRLDFGSPSCQSCTVSKLCTFRPIRELTLTLVHPNIETTR